VKAAPSAGLSGPGSHNGHLCKVRPEQTFEALDIKANELAENAAKSLSSFGTDQMATESARLTAMGYLA